ncbi:unnamed protein product [Cuscuta campestris]|uniref:C2 domain-containing protein n=1 Tax=Cuscuta campestris TaxID=132261 RepID=A0A484KN69_9ASTE|nr:unnamed protein product [Cuscuta campestris]
MDNLLGVLKVRIKRGVNLAVRDVRTSDPYVVVKMGKQKLKTRVIEKDVNPVWNEDLTLSVSDPNIPIKLVKMENLKFTGKEDCEVHLNSFHQSATMMGCIGEEECILFFQSLRGEAAKWFNKLPSGKIDSFDELATKFKATFKENFTKRKKFTYLSTARRPPNTYQEAYHTALELAEAETQDHHRVKPVQEMTVWGIYTRADRTGGQTGGRLSARHRQYGKLLDRRYFENNDRRARRRPPASPPEPIFPVCACVRRRSQPSPFADAWQAAACLVACRALGS